MQGYHPDLHGRHHVVAQPSGLLHDHGSPSGSDDDGGYLTYPDSHQMEPGLEDDPNAALTSQTLNADGTPKRPMNAFMIFARRRRPQVASENQSMRTGEVSKILSREWNAMSLSDKQFYLDQAKILKDNFNQKYPDYVYKRRPNNSRKRRKADSAPGPSADPSSSDLVDDYAGNAEYSGVSPVDVADVDDPRVSGQEARYASLPADPSGGTYSSTQSRASSYQPPDASYRPLGDTRVSYVSRPGRATPDTGVGSPISSTARGSGHSLNYYHIHPSTQQHHAQSPTYFTETSSTGDVWSGARDDQSRVHMQSWSQDSHDLGADGRHRGYPQPVPSHSWTTTSALEGMPSSSSSEASMASLNFPMLNSPFYPPQSSAQEGLSPTSVPPVSVGSQHFGTVASTPGNPVSGRSYPPLQHAYGSGSPSAIDSYQPQARAVSLSLTPGQPVTSYSQAQPTNPPPPTGSGGDPSQLHYWSRER